MKSAGITSVLSSEPPTAVLPEPAADKCLLPIFLFPYHLNLSEQANIKITVTYFHQWLPLVWLLPSQVPWNKLLPKKKGGITATVTGQGELDAGNSDLCFCVRLLHQSWQASNSRYDAEDKLWKHRQCYQCLLFWNKVHVFEVANLPVQIWLPYLVVAVQLTHYTTRTSC